MKIKDIVCAYFGECLVIFKCEHCGNEWRGCVSDSQNYFDEVLPNLHCELCGKSSSDNAN